MNEELARAREPQIPRPLISPNEHQRMITIEAIARVMTDIYWDEFSGEFTPPQWMIARLHHLAHRIPLPPPKEPPAYLSTYLSDAGGER